MQKSIKERLDELDTIQKHKNYETFLTMLTSEYGLKEEWDNECDETWNDLLSKRYCPNPCGLWLGLTKLTRQRKFLSSKFLKGWQTLFGNSYET